MVIVIKKYLIKNENGLVAITDRGDVIVHIRGKECTEKYIRRRTQLMQQINGAYFFSDLSKELQSHEFYIENGLVEDIICSINSGSRYIITANMIKDKPIAEIQTKYFIKTDEFEIDILNEEAFNINGGVWVTAMVDFEGDVEILNIFTNEVRYIKLSELEKHNSFTITKRYINNNFKTKI